MLEDAELLRRYARDKSEAAFAELVARYLDLVYAAALRQLGGDSHRAQDVSQVVFTTLARKAGALTSHPVLAGWLYTATQHASAKAMRTEARRRTREHEAYLMHESLSPPSPSNPASDWDRVRPVLDDALRELKENDREAIILRFFARRAFVEIGRTLNLSEDAARMRVERALDKLRVLLTRRQITSTTAALSLLLANQPTFAVPAGLVANVTEAALAGAGAGTFAAATPFLMTKPALVASLAALAAIIFAVRESSQHRAADAATAAAQSELAGLRIQLRESDRRVVAAEQQTTALRRQIEAQPTAASGAPTAASIRPGAQGVMMLSASDPTAIGQSPRGMTLVEAFASVYDPLYRQLGLAPEQRERFTALMVGAKEEGNELFGAAVAAGVKPSQDLLKEIERRTFPEREAKIRETFGEATLQAFQHFEATAPLRSMTSQLASTLFRSETPLSPAQADQLVTLMGLNVPMTEGRIDVLGTNLETLLLQAQGTLLPAQLQAFRRMMENAQAAAQIRREQKK